MDVRWTPDLDASSEAGMQTRAVRRLGPVRTVPQNLGRAVQPRRRFCRYPQKLFPASGRTHACDAHNDTGSRGLDHARLGERPGRLRAPLPPGDLGAPAEVGCPGRARARHGRWGVRDARHHGWARRGGSADDPDAERSCDRHPADQHHDDAGAHDRADRPDHRRRWQPDRRRRAVGTRRRTPRRWHRGLGRRGRAGPRGPCRSAPHRSRRRPRLRLHRRHPRPAPPPPPRCRGSQC